MRTRKLSVLSIVLILVITISLLIKPVLSHLAEFLTFSQKVRANVLIIEGWLSYRDLNSVSDEITSGNYDFVLITGIKSKPGYYNVHSNGFLIFYTGKSYPVTESIKIVEVRASSEMGGNNAAHFNLWINDSLVSSFNAGKCSRNYSQSWNGERIDSVMIEFDNDLNGSFGDRNLYVSKVILDRKTEIPFLNNSVYDIAPLDNRNRIINNMNSNAELTAKRLIAMGIDSSLIIAVPGRKVRINRTLTSALAVRDWMRQSGKIVSGINIISTGTHSRRTWMTFKKILGENVGIIALPDRLITPEDKVRVLKTMRELTAFIYYSVILLPY
jgi:hypothetical protein